MGKKLKVVIFVSFLQLYFNCSPIFAAQPNTITDTLDNGCNITRSTNKNATTKPKWWFSMPLPHLNCSGTGITRLDVEGIVNDTKSLTLSYNDMIELHVDDLKHMKNLQKIEIKSNKLQRIVESEEDLVLPDLYYLSLKNNKLGEVPNEALKSFPGLTVLILYNNEIQKIKADDFRYNNKLSALYLGPNPVSEFNEAWMAKLNLTGLNVRGCSLTKLPSALPNMHTLRYADFSGNRISEVKANSFSSCKSLRWLELAANQISVIDDDAFQGAYKLISLDLSDNLIETLTEKTFAGIGQENIQIDLYENPLNCNCSMFEFKRWSEDLQAKDMSAEIRYTCRQPLRNHGKKSKELSSEDFTCKPEDDLWQDCNKLVTTSPPALQTTADSTASRTCPSSCTCYDKHGTIYYSSDQKNANKYVGWLKWMLHSYPRVDCIDTKFTKIPPEIPDDVVVLVITGNQIPTLQLSDLKRFSKLQVLFFNGNGLETLKSDKATVLPYVKAVTFTFNKLKSLTKEHLKSFPNLKTIGLYHNAITNFPIDLFANNRLLQRMYIGHNPVQDFNEDFMKTLDLRSMSLKNMSIKTVPKSIANLVNLSYADFSDNLITTVKNSTFAKAISLRKLVLENNQISTIEANAFNGATTLRNILLTENQLTTLPATVFTNVTELELTVELWENLISCDCNMKPFMEWLTKAEEADPTLEIRFTCHQPLRMHGSKSEDLSAEDFICQNNDQQFVAQGSACPPSNPAGQFVLAVILTFVLTLALCFIICRCTFKRRYGELLNYAKQRDDYADMEELQ